MKASMSQPTTSFQDRLQDLTANRHVGRTPIGKKSMRVSNSLTASASSHNRLPPTDDFYTFSIHLAF